MQKVRGINAMMIISTHPAPLSKWYAKHLGIKTKKESDGNYYGTVTDAQSGAEIHFGIYPATAPLARGKRAVMINYRVGDLDAFIGKLRRAGVRVTGRKDEPYGSFAYLKDRDGNPIEIWMEVGPAR